MKRPFPSTSTRKPPQKGNDDPVKGLKNALKTKQVAGLAALVARLGGS